MTACTGIDRGTACDRQADVRVRFKPPFFANTDPAAPEYQDLCRTHLEITEFDTGEAASDLYTIEKEYPPHV